MKTTAKEYNFPSLAALYRQAPDRETITADRARFIGADREQIEARRFTWTEGARKLNELPELNRSTAKAKRAKRWSMDDGDDMHVERYHDDRPFMRQRVKVNAGTKRGRIQKIRVNVAESCKKSADAMLWKTYAAARIVDSLERAGIRCEVETVCSIKDAFTSGTRRDYIARVTVKRADQPLNLGAITTAASPWALRWHFVNHMATHPNHAAAYGRPQHMPPEAGALDIETGECLDKYSAERWILNQAVQL
jgi:hypothetical protein